MNHDKLQTLINHVNNKQTYIYTLLTSPIALHWFISKFVEIVFTQCDVINSYFSFYSITFYFKLFGSNLSLDFSTSLTIK